MSVLSEKAAIRSAPEPSFVEFVVIIAFMMALGSMSIDNLLPAFGHIQHDFSLASANEGGTSITRMDPFRASSGKPGF